MEQFLDEEVHKRGKIGTISYFSFVIKINNFKKMTLPTKSITLRKKIKRPSIFLLKSFFINYFILSYNIEGTCRVR